MPSKAVAHCVAQDLENNCDEVLKMLNIENRATDTELRANYQKGFWELTITHQKELLFEEYDESVYLLKETNRLDAPLYYKINEKVDKIKHLME